MSRTHPSQDNDRYMNIWSVGTTANIMTKSDMIRVLCTGTWEHMDSPRLELSPDASPPKFIRAITAKYRRCAELEKHRQTKRVDYNLWQSRADFIPISCDQVVIGYMLHLILPEWTKAFGTSVICMGEVHEIKFVD